MARSELFNNRTSRNDRSNYDDKTAYTCPSGKSAGLVVTCLVIAFGKGKEGAGHMMAQIPN
jgi:hypothetical protein